MDGELFSLSSHCRTVFSLPDKKDVHQSLNKPKIKLTNYSLVFPLNTENRH
jgi:hypothetical protein